MTNVIVRYLAIIAIIFLSAVFFAQPAEAGLILHRPNYTGLNAGLVGFWSFDGRDMDSSKAYYRSGQNNHGTLTNGPRAVSGKLGQALSFDGVNDYNDYVDIGNKSIFDSDTITISAWLKTPYSLAGTAVSRDDDANRIFIFGLGSTINTFRMAVFVGNTQINAQSSTNYTNNEWHHVVGVYDGSNVILYTDALQTAITSAPGVLDKDPVSLRIGNRASNNTDLELNGAIDDVRIYNRALSPDEIKRLYRIGATLHVNTQINNDSLSKGLVGWWTFDGKDTDSSKAYDRSGQNNHGTLTNGPKFVRGKLGQALEFDGVNDYVDVGNILSGGASGITLGAWVNPSALDSDRRVICKATSTATSDHIFCLLVRSSDDVEARIKTSNGSNRVKSDLVLSANEWSHIAATYDGSSIHFYLNGRETECVIVSGTCTPTGDIVSSDQIVTLGALNATPDSVRNFNGLIDDVRIYNRALSGDEIKRLYQIGGGR